MLRILFLIILLMSVFNTQAAEQKRVAVVTGASGGIGKTVVEALVKEGGYRVYGTTRNKLLVGDREGYTMVQMDPGETASVNRAIAKIADKEAGIDVLVNNAGYMVLGSVESVDPDSQLSDMFNVNVVGYARTTRAVIPSMRKKGAGLILNITSVQVVEPRGLQEGYSATRTAVEAMSLGQSSYLKEYGIRVVVFEPGATKTEIAKNAPLGSTQVEGDRAGARAAALKALMIDRLATGADPGDVAKKIVAVIKTPDPDFRNPADVKVMRRAEYVYKDATGNGLRKKLYDNYKRFVEQLQEKESVTTVKKASGGS